MATAAKLADEGKLEPAASRGPGLGERVLGFIGAFSALMVLIWWYGRAPAAVHVALATVMGVCALVAASAVLFSWKKSTREYYRLAMATMAVATVLALVQWSMPYFQAGRLVVSLLLSPLMAGVGYVALWLAVKLLLPRRVSGLVAAVRQALTRGLPHVLRLRELAGLIVLGAFSVGVAAHFPVILPGLDIMH